MKDILVLFKKIMFGFLKFLKSLVWEDSKDGNSFMNMAKNIVIALFLALVIRSFLYEPFHIPSGSMKPGLKEGDFIFVSKYDFGYSRYSFPFGLPIFKDRVFFKKEPARGDVLVFRLPSNPRINYIKRLIGLPGDKVQMIDGILYVNDLPVPKEYLGQSLEYENDNLTMTKEYEETLDNGKKYIVFDKFNDGAGDDTPFYIVPDGYYFFLGDNRDNSIDSRFSQTGLVPRENLIGKARIIFFSKSDSLFKFWNWGSIIRFNRIFNKIK